MIMLGRYIKKSNNENGQAVVELALVMPILLIILCGIIDFGWIITHQSTIDYLAREGARYAIVNTEDDSFSSAEDIISYTESLVTTLGKNITVEVTYTDSSDPRSGDVIVTVYCDVTLLTPIAGIFTNGQVITLESVCQMKVE